MPVINANPGPVAWAGPRPGSFRPAGSLHDVGDHIQANPRSWSSKKTLAGRIIVGFNVGKKPRWNIDDLIPIVKKLREKQAGIPDASFIAQKGIYRHKDPRHGTVVEDGAQVLIIDMAGTKRSLFEAQMVELAEQIAKKFAQELVIVEIQVNGLTDVTIGVTPE